jgi:hypothetical protein
LSITAASALSEGGDDVAWRVDTRLVSAARRSLMYLATGSRAVAEEVAIEATPSELHPRDESQAIDPGRL